MSGIEGKIVAITGASGGIGEATVNLLAKRGAKVVLGARRVERLEQICKRLAEAGSEAAYCRVDVKERHSLQEFVALAQERFGRLDVLINNAAIMPVSPLDDLRVDEWDEMIDINIKGVLHGIAAALPVFRKQNSGHIVNIASLAGHRVRPNTSVYSGTKFAVRAISEGLRQEAGDKLRVTIISPGVVQTELLETVKREDLKASLTEYAKIGLSPETIARALVFAIEQPDDVDVNEIVVRPTAQPL